MLYWPIHQASHHQIPVQLYPSHFLANTYFRTPWHCENSLVILGCKALNEESNPDGVIHKVVLISFLLHSPSSYHCLTPLPHSTSTVVLGQTVFMEYPFAAMVLLCQVLSSYNVLLELFSQYRSLSWLSLYYNLKPCVRDFRIYITRSRLRNTTLRGPTIYTCTNICYVWGRHK